MDVVAVTIAAVGASEVLPVARPAAEPIVASNSIQQPSFILNSAVQIINQLVPSSPAADLQRFIAHQQVL